VTKNEGRGRSNLRGPSGTYRGSMEKNPTLKYFSLRKRGKRLDERGKNKKHGTETAGNGRNIGNSKSLRNS